MGRWKKIIRYIYYPFHISENMALLTESRNTETEEKVEHCVLISFKLKYFQLRERRGVKMQEKKKKMKCKRPRKLLKLRRLT